MNRFTGKVALVTGAASGIGAAAAERIAAEGGRVFCTDLNEKGLSEVVQGIEQNGGTATAHTFDISDERQVDDCVKACVDAYGKIDTLINMAGILRFDNCHELALKDWQKLIDVNLTGTFLMCRAALPELLKTRGNIVNAASTSSLAGLPWGAAYSATKGGVLSMTRSIAIEYGKRGVRANCVCPGDIKTNIMGSVTFPADADMSLLPRISSLTGEKGPEVVTGAIALLASDDAVHINGEHIRVDGATLS